MRAARTLTYLLLSTFAVACASGEADRDPKATDGEEETSTAEVAPETRGDTTDTEKPAFNPQFEETPAPAEKPADEECIDNGDPGGTDNTATRLEPVSDCSDNHIELTGRMKGASDIDLYKLSASDDGWGCQIETEIKTETRGIELCVFARRKDGEQGFESCKAGGKPATSDLGDKGCCITGPGDAAPNLKWTLGSDAVDFTIRVRQPSGNACVPYSIKYRF